MMGSFLKRLILVALGIFISIFIAEFVLRVYYTAADKQWFDLKPQRTTLKFYDNDIIGSMLVPKSEGWFVSETKEYYTRVDVNSHGWPDVEHSYNKPDGVYRILILGDSFVENIQVPLESRFFRQLQNKLGDKIEIIAMGRGNTGPAQQILMLKEFGLKYDPDLVVQAIFTANDIKNNSQILQNDPYLPFFDIDESGKLVELPHIKRQDRKLANSKELLKNLRLAELFLSVRQKVQEYKANRKIGGYAIDYHVYDQVYNSDFEKAWAITQALLLETKKLATDSGAEYVIVTLTNNEQLNPLVRSEIEKNYPEVKMANLDYQKPNKLIEQFCTEKELTCWHMLPFFSQYLKSMPDSIFHYFYDGHWNQLGSDLAAEFLLKELNSYLIIK